MNYKIIYSSNFDKTFSKLDKGVQKIIFSWIEKNLLNNSNPRLKAKSLKYELKEYWRYKIGDYRIISEIIDDKLILILINICHRKEIYKKL